MNEKHLADGVTVEKWKSVTVEVQVLNPKMRSFFLSREAPGQMLVCCGGWTTA